MNQSSWYGAKCIFEHKGLAQADNKTIYEERIVLIRAVGFDDAIRLGEAEAESYAAETDGVRYVGFINVFQIFDHEMKEGAEVYSIMRESGLPVREFLDHYYDDGTECTQ